MLSNHDQGNVSKASKTVSIFVQDLRNLIKADDPLLAEMGIEILKVAVQIEQTIKRIECISK